MIGSLGDEDRSELLEAVAQGVRQEDIAFAFEALQRIKAAAVTGETPSRHDQYLLAQSSCSTLEGFTRRILTPPSRLVPNLKTFVCEDHRPMPA